MQEVRQQSSKQSKWLVQPDLVSTMRFLRKSSRRSDHLAMTVTVRIQESLKSIQIPTCCCFAGVSEFV